MQEVFKALPYVVTIIVLIFTSFRKKKEHQPPAALGLPYFREETSKTIREQLEAVVEGNGGHNAYIQGYRIGGKSGTSEKLDEYTEGQEMKYVASYGCFAPADDPEVIMLIMADEPDNSIAYYGSTVVVPYARTVMSEILPYLGFYPEYTDEEYADRNVTVPLVQEKSLDSATATLDDMGLSYEVVGEGRK